MIENLLYLRFGASDLQPIARILPKNSGFFKNLAEAALVSFVNGSIYADTPFRSNYIDWEFGEDEQFCQLYCMPRQPSFHHC
jgi:hypothetical protein